MGSIGNLTVNVTANTEKLTKGLKHARDEVNLFGKAGSILSGNLTNAFAVLTAGLTLNKVISEIKAATNELQQLSSTAKQLGISAGALGGFEHAAALSTVSAETLSAALTTMEKNLGDGSDAFKVLGLSVTELKGLGADQVFLKIADAISKLPTVADKTTAAMAVFGKGNGAGMLGLINQGSAGIQKGIDEAQRMGLAPSEEDIKKIEQEEKSIIQLKEAYKGLTHQAAIYFAGAANHLENAGAFEAASVAMGADSSGTKAWDSTIGIMTDKKFDAMQAELSQEDLKYNSGAEGGLFTGGDMTHARRRGEIKQRHGITGDSDGYADEAIKRRQEQRVAQQRRDDEKAKRDARNAPWNAGSSFLGGLTSGFSFGDAMHGAAGSLGATAPAFAYREGGMGGLFNFLAPNDAAEKEGALKAQSAAAMAMWSGGMMGGAQTPNQFAGQQEQLDKVNKQIADTLKGKGDEMLKGGAALEQGSAAAFSQEKRSQQAMKQNELLTKQLTELKGLRADIKANKPQVVPTVTI